jgi:hypothetical protein
MKEWLGSDVLPCRHQWMHPPELYMWLSQGSAASHCLTLQQFDVHLLYIM